MRVCLLASGSKGNAVLVETGGSRVLIDSGLSATEVVVRLAGIGLSGSDIDGILITHEHSDHVRGVGALARKFKIPLMLSYPTCRSIYTLLKNVEITEFESGYPFTFRDLLIDPFPVTHDACDPVGFVIESSDGKIGIATDLGIATRLVKEKLKGSRVLVLESNHDEEMLLEGPYPWHLKQRIKSRHGHLSNVESAEMLDEIIHHGLEGVLLAHLSEVNNDPQVAYNVTANLLASQNICAPQLILGHQHRVSEVFTA